MKCRFVLTLFFMAGLAIASNGLGIGLKGAQEPPTAAAEPMSSLECPPRYTRTKRGRSCILVVETKATQELAREICRNTSYDINFGSLKWTGDLVKIPNSQENVLITSLTGPHSYWIGLHDQDDDGKYTWLDETQEASFKKFRRSPKNKKCGRGNCVELSGSKNGQWDDKRCDVKRRFICEAHLTGKLYGNG